MTRNENITRLAARAMEIDLVGHAWIDEGDNIGFFECFGGDVDLGLGFAPLSDPATAYQMEDKLRMEVSYKVIPQDRDQKLVISVRTQGHGGAVMHTAPTHHSSLKARMFAVTQFAALNCMMEGYMDPVTIQVSHGAP